VTSIKISKVCTRYIPTDDFPLCMVLIIPPKRLKLSSSYLYIYILYYIFRRVMRLFGMYAHTYLHRSVPKLSEYSEVLRYASMP